MVGRVMIKNFKSVKDLIFDVRRVNLFIGGANVGKRNILEALGLFSLFYDYDIKKFVRLENIIDLFWNRDISSDIEVYVGDFRLVGRVEDDFMRIKVSKGDDIYFDYKFSYNGDFIMGDFFQDKVMPLKYYRFRGRGCFFSNSKYSFLLPGGENLFSVLKNNQEIFHIVEGLLEEYGLKLDLDKGMVRSIGSNYDFRFSLLSKSLREMIFYFTMIKSNIDSVIIFETPDIFPGFMKFLGEDIAHDKKNQYFIVTYNPYFIEGVIWKTSKDDLEILKVEMKEYQTVLRKLNEQEKEDILLSKVDFNFI